MPESRYWERQHIITVVPRMAGDPTQPQPQSWRSESADYRQWYVVAGGGASALRMTPGLTVGEWESGALALNDPDPRNQWIEFVLADDGEPWATVVTRDRSLRVAGSTVPRHPLGVGATVRLPNNTLYISHDTRMPPLSETVVEVVHRDIPERVQDIVGPGLEEALAAVREPRAARAAVEYPESAAAPAGGDARPAPEIDRRERDDWSDHAATMTEPRRPRAAAPRRPVAVMAGALALGAATLAGLVAVLVSMDGRDTGRVGTVDSVALDTPPVVAPARPRVPADARGDAAPEPADPAAAPADRGLPETPPARPTDAPSGAVDTPPSTEPTDPIGQQPTQVARRPRTEADGPAPSVTPPAEPRVTSPVESTDAPVEQPTAPAEPSVAQTPGTSRTPSPAADREPTIDPPPVTANQPQTPDQPPPAAEPEPANQPDPAVVAELQEVGLTARAVATELALRRDLVAADLAVAQDRLVDPPEDSALALYNRVLAVDPGSPEAISGLQTVRQALINRALAQLAGAELDDARRTLQAAADAGADPRLLADLRREVDFRQQQIDPSAGGRGAP